MGSPTWLARASGGKKPKVVVPSKTTPWASLVSNANCWMIMSPDREDDFMVVFVDSVPTSRPISR